VTIDEMKKKKKEKKGMQLGLGIIWKQYEMPVMFLTM
jgi:hypothetical protein